MEFSNYSFKPRASIILEFEPKKLNFFENFVILIFKAPIKDRIEILDKNSLKLIKRIDIA